MSAAAHMNGTLCEAELFLASLHSEESDTDAYDLFNTPPNGGLDIPFSAKGAAGPVSLTPESLQSQIGFGMNSVGLDNTEFGNFVDVKDAEARARASSSTLAGMVKMETDNSKRGSNLLSVLDNTSKDISIVDAGLVDTSSVATGLGHSVGKVSKPKRERMSHNIIEKKYRTNINDKILQLREIVPALRVAAKREEGLPVTDEDHSKLDGLEPARKLNKASILIKTIEYIKHLETKCAVYRMENLQLKQNNGFSTPESVRQASHTVPFATSTTVSTQHSADLSSGSSAVTSPANFAQAYPHGYGSTDLSSKILLGGLALTMGATCFGENDDFGNARGLFAMPVFQYSPATNSLTFSNSHGVPVNFGSSMLSLMRLLLFLYAIFRFAMAVFVRSLPQRNEKQQEDSSSLGKLVQYSDTLVFGTPTGLWSSLKKCLFISRLKYPENTIERVESEIAKCFILKIYSSSSNMWKFICDRYAASTWAKLVKRVDAANSLAPKKGHYYGLEWEMITNIMNADIEKTLESCEILENLQKSGNLAYSLRDFIAMVNDSIVASNTIFITSLLMQELMEEPQSDLDYIVENIYDHELKQDKTLELARESFIVLNALFNSSESAAKELLTLMKLDEDIAMENVNKDQLFVLYSIVVRQHIAAGNYQRLLNYVSQIPLSYLNAKDCSLVGATAVYLVLRYLLKNEKQLQGDSTLCILEELASKLRVWFGSDAGNVLDLEVRGKLINYCVDVALQSNEKLAGDLSSSSSENENESDFELSHDEKIS